MSVRAAAWGAEWLACAASVGNLLPHSPQNLDLVLYAAPHCGQFVVIAGSLAAQAIITAGCVPAGASSLLGSCNDRNLVGVGQSEHNKKCCRTKQLLPHLLTPCFFRRIYPFTSRGTGAAEIVFVRNAQYKTNPAEWAKPHPALPLTPREHRLPDLVVAQQHHELGAHGVVLLLRLLDDVNEPFG